MASLLDVWRKLLTLMRIAMEYGIAARMEKDGPRMGRSTDPNCPLGFHPQTRSDIFLFLVWQYIRSN